MNCILSFFSLRQNCIKSARERGVNDVCTSGYYQCNVPVRSVDRFFFLIISSSAHQLRTNKTQSDKYFQCSRISLSRLASHSHVFCSVKIVFLFSHWRRYMRWWRNNVDFSLRCDVCFPQINLELNLCEFVVVVRFGYSSGFSVHTTTVFSIHMCISWSHQCEILTDINVSCMRKTI